MTDTPYTAPDTFPDAATIAERVATQFKPSTNIDGWTGARQKRFLEAIADGETVRDACATVFLSPQSAYAFRRRPNGRAFDLGWKAADLLARERVAAELLIRATEGQTVEITRADGSTVTKHHYDNRLAVQMLNRLDRYADASDATVPGHAARAVAGDFDAYLHLIGAEAGPARAGLFMLGHGEAPAAELDAIVALARADRQLRCGTLATDVDIADLDPARRSEWTAEQWARAEACGLLVLAPPPAPPATCQPVSTPTPPSDDPLDEHVWLDPDSNEWRTDFPPPAGFDGMEDGHWSHPDYVRSLSEAELAQLGLAEPGGEEDLAGREAERDRWFLANTWPPATGEATVPSGADRAASTPQAADGEANGPNTPGIGPARTVRQDQPSTERPGDRPIVPPGERPSLSTV